MALEAKFGVLREVLRKDASPVDRKSPRMSPRRATETKATKGRGFLGLPSL